MAIKCKRHNDRRGTHYIMEGNGISLVIRRHRFQDELWVLSNRTSIQLPFGHADSGMLDDSSTPENPYSLAASYRKLHLVEYATYLITDRAEGIDHCNGGNGPAWVI